MDLLGAQVFTDDFMVAGDCTEALYGLCESMYRPDLEPDDLFETLAQCLLSGVDRDCLAVIVDYMQASLLKGAPCRQGAFWPQSSTWNVRPALSRRRSISSEPIAEAGVQIPPEAASGFLTRQTALSAIIFEVEP